ncbi:DUF2274 domain-containing protein [Acidomonas methanolica]|nr:DUF2274 domain-containing protein [Acidomonas methanolica]
MTKLRLGRIEDARPVRVMVELPAAVHRDLVAYAASSPRMKGMPSLSPDLSPDLRTAAIAAVRRSASSPATTAS